MFSHSLSENILFFIAGLGILQAILLSALIYFHPRSDRSVNIFLALHIFCLGLILSMPIVVWATTWKKIFFMEPFPLLLGPFLYLYVRSFRERITWRKALPHVSFAFLYVIVFYIPVTELANRYSDEEQVPKELLMHPLLLGLALLRHGQSLLYYFLSRRRLTSYQRSLHQLYSETSRIDPRWIRWLINGFLFLTIATILIFSFMVRFPEYFDLLFMINIALATPYIYIAAYKGVTQSTLWQLPGINKKKIEKELDETEKGIQPPATAIKPKAQPIDSKMEEIRSRILEVMEQEKIYQETELTLLNLADKLQVPSYQVSQAINEGMKKNFYELVNSYRVEEAKRLLADPESRNYTILSVGFEAGFNSKTTFNTVFKKFTGLTPTEYRMEQKDLSMA